MIDFRKWRQNFSRETEQLRLTRLAEGISQGGIGARFGKAESLACAAEGGHRPLRPKDAAAIRAALLRLTQEKGSKNGPEMATKPGAEMAGRP